MKYMSSFLALQARLSDPQRALTDHFVRQVAEMQKAEKAKKKMEEKKAKKVRWRQWSLEGLVGEHTLEVLFGRCWEGYILTKNVRP
jgi:predicted Holliday junction resolvase-like endonuclease